MGLLLCPSGFGRTLAVKVKAGTASPVLRRCEGPRLPALLPGPCAQPPAPVSHRPAAPALDTAPPSLALESSSVPALCWRAADGNREEGHSPGPPLPPSGPAATSPGRFVAPAGPGGRWMLRCRPGGVPLPVYSGGAPTAALWFCFFFFFFSLSPSIRPIFPF